MTISLTDVEVQKLLTACSGYIEMMMEGDDTPEQLVYEMQTGLGSALRKIGKGRNIERVYEKYKTVSQCPTFEEWKAARKESEE